MKTKELERFAKLWNNGNSAASIAYEFGTTVSAVYTIASRNRDVCRHRQGGEPDPKLVRRIGRARQSGASVKDIAEAYHVCTATVSRYARRYEDMSCVEPEPETVEDMLRSFAFDIDYTGACDVHMVDSLVRTYAEKLRRAQ